MEVDIQNYEKPKDRWEKLIVKINDDVDNLLTAVPEGNSRLSDGLKQISSDANKIPTHIYDHLNETSNKVRNETGKKFFTYGAILGAVLGSTIGVISLNAMRYLKLNNEENTPITAIQPRNLSTKIGELEGKLKQCEDSRKDLNSIMGDLRRNLSSQSSSQQNLSAYVGINLSGDTFFVNPKDQTVSYCTEDMESASYVDTKEIALEVNPKYKQLFDAIEGGN